MISILVHMIYLKITLENKHANISIDLPVDNELTARISDVNSKY